MTKAQGTGETEGWTGITPGEERDRDSNPVVFEFPKSLAGRYEDQGEVARGGFGSVRKIYDLELLRHIALKVLDPFLSDKDDAVQRFTEEAQITGQLDHPNIVPVHGIGTDPEGARFFMMKLVQGNTLHAEIHRGEALPWTAGRLDDLLTVFVKVCDAVAFAHSRDVIHRDIKPQNIMVGDFGQVYLMDWGVARVLTATYKPSQSGSHKRVSDRPPVDVKRSGGGKDIDQPSSLLGTPAYMAPEQALGFHDKIDARTDVFTLGAVLYEILTRRTPHQGPSMWGLIYAAATCDIVSPEKVVPEAGLPMGLCKIAMRAMARDPADRYQNAMDLKADVERYLRGSDRVPTRVYAPGERVITEGEAGNTAFVITSGRCVVFKTLDGERLVLREMGPGEVFGETAVFTSKPRTASVEAVNELSVMIVTRDSLGQHIGPNTYMGSFVRALAERFRELDSRLDGVKVHHKARGFSAMENTTRRVLCRLIAGIVVADDDLDDAESGFIDRMLARFGLNPQDREALFPIIDASEAAAELKLLPQKVQHEAFVLLIEAATLDGRYVDEERNYLYKVGAVIGLLPSDIDARVQEALGA